MIEDQRMLDLGDMPFDSKRMIMGGFEPMIAYHKAD